MNRNSDKEIIQSNAKNEFWSRATIVMVTHNSEAVISSSLKGLKAAKHVIVVDNASIDSTTHELKRMLPDAKIIMNPINTGFGTAANLAFSQTETEFAFLVAPDSIVDQNDLIKLIEVADRWPNAAMVSPVLLTSDGRETRCHDRDLFSRKGLPQRRDQEPFPTGDLCAGFVQIAVTLIRMEALNNTGLFDSRFFLFFEDDDICIRFVKKRWELILTPSVTVRHIDGGSAGVTPAITRRRHYHMAWSRIYLEKKYRGFTPAILLGTKHLCVFASKTIWAILSFNKNKLTRDSARLLGTISYLFGLSTKS